MFCPSSFCSLRFFLGKKSCQDSFFLLRRPRSAAIRRGGLRHAMNETFWYTTRAGTALRWVRPTPMANTLLLDPFLALGPGSMIAVIPHRSFEGEPVSQAPCLGCDRITRISQVRKPKVPSYPPEFAALIAHGSQVAVMPVSRVSLYDHMRIGDFILSPAGAIDFSLLRPIPNRTMEEATVDQVTSLIGQDHREVLTSLTGFNVAALAENATLAFATNVNWQSFLTADHAADRRLIRRLCQVGEPAIDLLRYEFCRFDLPESLPGRVGSWNGSGSYQGALVFDPLNHESWLIGAPIAVSSVVVRGIGLELEVPPEQTLPSPSDGEVGAIVRHALSLYTEVLEANSDTSKFIRAMTLLEFLASPNDYLTWKKAKKEIACHLASTRARYNGLLDRFRELTHFPDASGQERGYRTLVIHHGKFLDDIIPDETSRATLFRELQGYAWPVLQHMLERPALRWSEFLDYRKQLKCQIGVASKAED